MLKKFYTKVIFIFLIGLFTQSTLFAIPDSLQVELQTAKTDSQKVDIYDDYFWHTINNDVNEAYKIVSQLKLFALENKFPFGEIIYHNDVGVYYKLTGSFDTALFHFNLALKQAEEWSNKAYIGKSYINIANIYISKDDFVNAVTTLKKGLELFEETNDSVGCAKVLSNLGGLMLEQRLPQQALENYQRAYSIFKDMNHLFGQSYVLQNLVHVQMRELKNFEVSLELLNELSQVNEKLGEQRVIGTTWLDYGFLYQQMRSYQKAIDALREGLKINLKLEDPFLIAENYGALGQAYYHLQKMDSAMHYYQKSYQLGKELDLVLEQAEGSKSLAEIYAYKKDFKTAFEYQSNYLMLNDSLLNQDIQAQLATLEKQYKTKEQQQEIKLQKAELESQKHEIAQQRMFAFSLIGGCVLLGIIVVIVYWGYKQKKSQNIIIERQKKLVEEQKHLVEEKNTEITDSITYAKGIQDALLPEDNELKLTFPESFVLFQPKDIVSGDFYWKSHLPNPSGGGADSLPLGELEGVFFAVADCTGHGVPGAMVSVVCCNALNKVTNELGITEPAEILNHTREIVIDTLNKNEAAVKDGMDISLIKVKPTKDGANVLFAGAHNPLWIIQNSELIELKASKQPIGLYQKLQPFNQQEIELNKGDIMYLFSDGFADQFGGPKGKKFMSKRFKKLLIDNAQLSMQKQQELLQTTITEWMKESDQEQIDDITVAGIKIT